MAGDWAKADHYLHLLQPMVEGKEKEKNIVVSFPNISFSNGSVI